ncbi:predicted protein [Thalassiosira pseudonana CCMP1335]|jgi:calcyclin binding protein|uniref:Calcyclin-binding protein n=1 Tax=Thalassiosira pseudonana TaxID=35128 RepID=B8LED0_THAPS|nr:predicted protein [Thalassiosira pseudonana CCMP1335]EED86332.1 predicted protein [Thalassiosira pseudonana CCMP1335]|eukprot:g8351.t1 g8351   contig29:328084-328959(-)
MVEISEVMDEEQPQQATASTPMNAADSRSAERLSDADEIEAALSHITRPSARLHVENLVTKLRKEGKALERVAAASNKTSASGVEDVAMMEEDDDTKKEAAPLASAPIPLRTPAAETPITSSTSKYQSFPTYYFDAGQYNSPTVSVYVPLDSIGSHDKSNISCDFTSSSFDLVVSDYEGKSYRLLNDNLEHDIDVSKSKYVIKPNKIIIKLGKIKGEYSYDHWTQLTAKKKKTPGVGKKDDPTAGIMDMMKDMYESGDDNMKKMIGETMYKQRTGQLNKDDPMGGMGDLGF